VTVRRILRRSAGGFAVVVACAALATGCAERIGQRAAAGAVTELQRRHDQNPDQRPMKIAAASAVQGALDALETPEQRARFERMVSQVAAAAAQTVVEEATRQVVAELGAQGQGPLAISLSRTGERVASSAVGSVGAQLAALVPECDGPDQLGCIEQRLQRTARSTAASFTAGVRESLGWQLLLVAFGLGAGGGVLGAWLWSLRHYRRRSLRLA